MKILDELKLEERAAWDQLQDSMRAYGWAVENDRPTERLMDSVADARRNWWRAMEAVARARTS